MSFAAFIFAPPAQAGRGPRWPWRLALAFILLAAFAIRLQSISFGLPAITDMDELMFELGALRMIGGGQLNPQWFGHPATTTMYLLALIAVGVFGAGLMTGRFTDVDGLIAAVYNNPGVLVLPQRIGIALFAVLGVALAYRLAARLFDRQTGLATALILAVSPVHIHYSQLLRSDMMATTFMLATMLFALTYAREGGRRAFIGAVLCLALAITTKWPFTLSLLALTGALVLRWRSGLLTGRDVLGLSALAVAGTLLAMVMISPFLLIEFDTVVANLSGEVQPHHLGATGGGFFENAWWYASGALLRALGPAGLTLAVTGLWLARRQRELIAVVLLPCLAMYALACSQNIVWERWVLGVVPVLAMLAAHGLVRIIAALDPVRPRLVAAAAAAALAGVVLVPLFLSAQADARERMNDTRLMASAWLRKNAAPDSTIFVEHFAFDLVDSEFDYVFPLGAAGCKDARSLISSRIDNSMVEGARNGRTNIDYGTVEPALIDTCRADYAVLSQYSRYIAEKDRFPQEYDNYRRLMAAGTVVAEFRPERGVAGGWPVLILHFEGRGTKAATTADNARAPGLAGQ